MNDFIIGNNFTVADHLFEKNVAYTYFNIPRDIHTWIDHIMSTGYDVNNINNCQIIPLDEYNMSDHLSVRMYINLYILMYLL